MKHKCRNGLTIIEVLIAIMLIGVEVAGLVAANGSLTQLNGAGVELSTAEFLIEQVRERTAGMEFASLNSLDSRCYGPPQDATGIELADYSNYEQQIRVKHVTNDDLTVLDNTGISDYIRISVDIVREDRIVSSGSWIRAKY